jgi:hypothetical protein
MSKLVKALEIARCVLESHNLSYYLDTGLLIGSLRHGGIVPTDYDVDMAVFLDSQHALDTFTRAFRNEDVDTDVASLASRRMGVHVRTVINGRVHANVLVDGDFHCDIWRHQPFSGDLYEQNRPWVYETMSNDSTNRRIWAPVWSSPEYSPETAGSLWLFDDVFPLASCSVFGKAFACPRRPVSFLRSWKHWGTEDFLKTPWPEATQQQMANMKRHTLLAQACLHSQRFPTLET